MAKTLLLLLTFLPVTLLGQQLKCCESTEEVESYVNGVWKVKNKNSKTRYTYSFEDGQGQWTEMESTEKKDDDFIAEDQPFMYTIAAGQGFTLKINHSYGDWIGELKSLNSRKMIIVSNGKETKFIKKSN